MLANIEKWNQELGDINKVLEKLLEKQNSSVFDKLCAKCNSLCESIFAVIKPGLSLDDIHALRELLIDIRKTCVTLSEYKKYLIAMIDQNLLNLSLQEKNATMNSSESKSEDISSPEIPASGIVANNPEVKSNIVQLTKNNKPPITGQEAA